MLGGLTGVLSNSSIDIILHYTCYGVFSFRVLLCPSLRIKNSYLEWLHPYVQADHRYDEIP
ncbi:hypothetical protein Avbf_12624 [Armadillidium vulgare]|nr:hypothetical protein Avbf_12624 [Armadillidium vulgare]